MCSIRNWMKSDFMLSFKKVNIRFKPTWTSEDLIAKLKYLWILRFLSINNYHITYMDEFGICDSSIKQYNWSPRGVQNYWFGQKKANRFNWIIGVSNSGRTNIHIQKDPIDSAAFASFVTDTYEKLRNVNEIPDNRIVFVFDNASIHKSSKRSDREDKLMSSHSPSIYSRMEQFWACDSHYQKEAGQRLEMQ